MSDIREPLKKEMITGLQTILMEERKHFAYYLQASMVVRGFDRVLLKPLFEKEMMGELEHIRLFGDKIVALGSFPTLEANNYTWTIFPSGKYILEEAIKMEREVLELYHSLYIVAENYGVIFHDKSIVLLLEENIEHTTKDVEEMEKIVSSFSFEN